MADPSRGPDDALRGGPGARTGAAVRAASAAAGWGIFLGQGGGAWAWAGAQRSALVLGPSRSGKTSSLIIPNVLAAPGPVVSTSTKPDVLWATARSRATVGKVMLFDPSGEIETPDHVTRVGWSPLHGSGEWDGAVLAADAMVRAARATNGRTGDVGGDHWSERASALLGPLLHAASLGDVPMATLLRWVDRHDGTPALDLLGQEAGEHAPSTDLLAGILTTDSREQSGIWSTASGVLSVYRSRAALSSTDGPRFDPAQFLDGPHTLYICASGRQQHLLAPLVVGLVSDVRDATYRRDRTGPTGSPVLLALDEVANIAPIHDLPAMVSEGPGQGLLTLACLQDLSQARGRWGSQADGFVSLFGTTIVLAGIADAKTLESLSMLSGDVEVPTRTVGASQGRDRRVHPSVSVTTVQRRRLPPDVIARGMPGQALVIDARNRMGWVGLSPAHLTSPWRELVAARERSRTPTSRDTSRVLGR